MIYGSSVMEPSWITNWCWSSNLSIVCMSKSTCNRKMVHEFGSHRKENGKIYSGGEEDIYNF